MIFFLAVNLTSTNWGLHGLGACAVDLGAWALVGGVGVVGTVGYMGLRSMLVSWDFGRLEGVWVLWVLWATWV